MKMEHFLDRLSDSQMPNKVLCLLVGYEMQYYFYINGLFSNAFSADGTQININGTAVLGERLITVPLCPPPIPFYTQGRSFVLTDRLFVGLS
jgi:hypothetical protein